jgi:hypothetical protein
MRTSTVIGSYVDVIAGLAWEHPGRTREYQVELAGSRLTLRRSDGRTFVFERLLDGSARRDIYGRPIVEKED